jgi:DNA-binding MarR family transcriptional regulator
MPESQRRRRLPESHSRRRLPESHSRRLPESQRARRTPVSNRDVAALQRWYPQIYLACHTRHQRRRSNGLRLTAHESSILAHLSAEHPLRASDLARHLGVGASTMSAALKRLTTLGYVARTREADDQRAASLRLSKLGADAMQAGSVLETGRVSALLGQLTGAEREQALAGLELLATAARRLPTRRRSGT